MPALSAFAVALVTVLGLTPPVRHLARQSGFVDRPARRKVHLRPVPLGGGVALVAGVIAGLIAASLAAGGAAFEVRSRFAAATLGGLLWMAGLGLRDDRAPLDPAWKLGGQVVGAAILVLGSGLPEPSSLHGFGIPVVLIGVVGLMNACNFLDNMDGVLSGIALVCASAFLAMASAASTPLAAAAGAAAGATAGAAAGFLAYNFAPARIFMGDSGSLALGFLLAAIALGLEPPDLPARPGLALVLVVGYPLFDLAFVTITRVLDHRKVWTPGKDHTSHRLDRLLGSPRRTALAVYALAAMTALAGLAVHHRPGPGSALLAAASSAALVALGVRLARVPVAPVAPVAG